MVARSAAARPAVAPYQSLNVEKLACSFYNPYIVKKRKYHVFIRDFTRTITRDAASGSRAVSARAVAALHFRAAVSQNAGTRASTATHLLRDVDQAKLPGLACP